MRLQTVQASVKDSVLPARANSLSETSCNHPRRARKAKKAKKRLKTIAGKILRELDRKMTASQQAFYEKDIALYRRAVNQQKNDRDSLERKRCTNQCINGCNCMEYEENDGKIERKNLAIYFSTVLPATCVLSHRLKMGF